MPKDNIVHIVKRGSNYTLCREDAWTKKFKWVNIIEHANRRLIIHNKLEMPTCSQCLKILEELEIEIVKTYEHNE